MASLFESLRLVCLKELEKAQENSVKFYRTEMKRECKTTSKGPFGIGECMLSIQTSIPVFEDSDLHAYSNLWNIQDSCNNLVDRFRDKPDQLGQYHCAAEGCVGSWTLLILVGPPGATVDVQALIDLVTSQVIPERNEWVERNFTRGRIREVRSPRTHPGNTEAAYLKELHEKASVEDSWILCVLFPTDAVKLFFYSKYEHEARVAMEKLVDVRIFGRKIEAVFNAEGLV